MDRCNELCTKETTGQCALCDALAKRDRFEWFWFKGGLFIDGVRALKSSGVFAFFVSRRTSLLLCLGALLLVLSIYDIYQYYWVIPNRQIGEPPRDPSHTTFSVKITAEKGELTRKEVYELRNSIRQTFAQALGLLGGLIGGAALLLGLFYTAQTLRTAQGTLRVNQETLRTTQQGQITERFTKAIEHVGDTGRLTVRLGGIYALERIATRDAPDYHWQIMEVLTAYVRDNAPWPPNQSSSSPEGPLSPKPATDIQAVLTVLGRRTRTSDREKEKFLDLAKTDLRGADFTGADLEEANLTGAHLEGADFTGAHLEGADFTGAHLKKANLTNAHLEGAHLDFADLEEAHLESAHLKSTNLTGAHLKKANLTNAHLEGAHLDFADLEEAHLESAHLKRTMLRDAHLKNARLDFADLVLVDLSRAHLEEAVLALAHLEGAVLINAHLEGAELISAHLGGGDTRRRPSGRS